MTTTFQLHFDRIEGKLDDPIEEATFARVQLTLGDRLLTRCASTRHGLRDYVKLPLEGLADAIATNWWTLLYEPYRAYDLSRRSAARHRLDAYTRGYLFPAFELWSAGDEVMTIRTGPNRRVSTSLSSEISETEQAIAARLAGVDRVNPSSFSRAQFVDESREHLTVLRGEVEDQLYDLVATTLDWIDGAGERNPTIIERWDRVKASIDDLDEKNYCIAAGRLGFDPYDPETPDISVFASLLPESSFDDLCEATPFDEIIAASTWVSEEQARLDAAPAIDLSSFGKRPAFDLAVPAWQSGYEAAIALRRNILLSEDPLKASIELVGPYRESSSEAPPSVEGVLVRNDQIMRSAVPFRSNGQRRFRTCRAVYLGWGAEPESYPLLTTASTYRQQSSRAFAAEMLCPADYLRHQAGRHGLTPDAMSEIAERLDCQFSVVELQARNHNIPTRGFY